MNIKCPGCKKKIKWEGNFFAPFCSERCKMTDLGAWASEKYKIEGERKEIEEDDEDASEDKEE